MGLLLRSSCLFDSGTNFHFTFPHDIFVEPFSCEAFKSNGWWYPAAVGYPNTGPYPDEMFSGRTDHPNAHSQKHKIALPTRSKHRINVTKNTVLVHSTTNSNNIDSSSSSSENSAHALIKRCNTRLNPMLARFTTLTAHTALSLLSVNAQTVRSTRLFCFFFFFTPFYFVCLFIFWFRRCALARLAWHTVECSHTTRHTQHKQQKSVW